MLQRHSCRSRSFHRAVKIPTSPPARTTGSPTSCARPDILALDPASAPCQPCYRRFGGAEESISTRQEIARIIYHIYPQAGGRRVNQQHIRGSQQATRER